MAKYQEILEAIKEIRVAQEEQKIEQAEIKTVLIGKNSDEGLVGQVNSNTKRINRIWIYLAGIAGVGGITTGVLQILN